MGEIERKIVCEYIGDRQPARGKERITRFGSVFVCVIRGNIGWGEVASVFALSRSDTPQVWQRK